MIKHWLGSEESFHAYMEAIEKAEVRRAEHEAKVRASNDEDEDDEEDYFPSIYQLIGDVAVVKISGSLVPGQALWMRYYGVLGYDDIKNALVKAVSDQKAKSILLHSNSGGGAVNGVQEAQTFISAVAKVKPMSVYSEFCCSAAYWLASAAGHITTSATAINGSIGVVRVAMEYSKQMEDNGVGVKVFRSGRYKMLVNPYEKLSEEAITEEQAKLNDLYDIFTAAVAANRGVSQTVVDTTMGQGREFLGRRGLEAGLVDALGSFEDALTYSRAKGSQFQQNTLNFQGGATRVVAGATTVDHNAATSNQTGTEMHLNQAQLAALAGGASMEDVLAMSTAGDAEQAPKDDKQPAATAEAPEAQKEPAATATDTSVAAYLKSELATAQAEAFAAKAELKAATEKAEAATADVAALAGIVQASVKHLHVALGKTEDVGAMSASQLVAAYSAACTAMQDKFKVGGVAKTTAAVIEDKPKAEAAQLLIAPRDEAAIKSLFKNKR